MRFTSLCALSICVLLLTACNTESARTVRVASFNAAMGMEHADELAKALESGSDERLLKLAAIVQEVDPDILLLNEFDYEASVDTADLLNNLYLAEKPYPYSFSGPVNTGVQSGLDLDGDGEMGGPGDAWGYGTFPGQYGMLILSRFPIQLDKVKDYREFRWNALPRANRPVNPDGTDFYTDATWGEMRLSSKSHWDVPVDVDGVELRILAHHPTPPVFDGPEDRIVRRAGLGLHVDQVSGAAVHLYNSAALPRQV